MPRFARDPCGQDTDEGFARARARCDLLARPLAVRLRYVWLKSDGVPTSSCQRKNGGLPHQE